MQTDPQHFSAQHLKEAKPWLILGVTALAVAGLFAILLVATRSPHVQNWLPLANAFQSALTVHVNLSVLVWLLAMGSMLFSLYYPQPSNPIVQKVSLSLSTLGMVAIALSPIAGDGEPLLNNYVPVLNNHTFFSGIILFLFGIFINALSFLYHVIHKAIIHKHLSITEYALAQAALLYLTALAALGISHQQLSFSDLATLQQTAPHDFYETLFWGGGHILQFLYTQWMLIAFYALLNIQPKHTFTAAAYYLIFTVQSIVGIDLLLSYASTPTHAPEHISIFMDAMRMWGGVAPALILPFFAWHLIQNRQTLRQSSTKWLLLWSFTLFSAGGVISLFISGINTIIPAHYHGSIVGITLSLMALSCFVLPQITGRALSSRSLFIQPLLYGGGQLLHIIGLAWSGGYGALRKTPGAMESAEGQAAMGLMGLGGLLSILGGIWFVWMCATALQKRH